jgi:hypothetical protein
MEAMQPEEFVRTREEEKGTMTKSPKNRCGKVGARNCRGVCLEAVLILIV